VPHGAAIAPARYTFGPSMIFSILETQRKGGT
jgi:hypothetical protein